MWPKPAAARMPRAGLHKPGRMDGRMAPAPSPALEHSKPPRTRMQGQLGSHPARLLMAHHGACLVLLPLLLLVLLKPAGAQQQQFKRPLAGRCLMAPAPSAALGYSKQPSGRMRGQLGSHPARLLMAHCGARLVLLPRLLPVLLKPARAQQRLFQRLLAGPCLLMERAQLRLLAGRQPLGRCLLSSTMSRKLLFSHTALNEPCPKSRVQLAGHCLTGSTMSRQSGLHRQSGSCFLMGLCRRACTKSTPSRKHAGWQRRSADSKLLHSRPASRRIWAHISPRLETQTRSSSQQSLWQSEGTLRALAHSQQSSSQENRQSLSPGTLRAMAEGQLQTQPVTLPAPAQCWCWRRGQWQQAQLAWQVQVGPFELGTLGAWPGASCPVVSGPVWEPPFNMQLPRMSFHGVLPQSASA